MPAPVSRRYISNTNEKQHLIMDDNAVFHLYSILKKKIISIRIQFVIRD